MSLALAVTVAGVGQLVGAPPPQPIPVGWDSVSSVATHAFAARHGDGLDAGLAGLKTARSRVGGAVRSARVDAAAEVDAQGNSPAEVSAQAALDIDVANGAAAERRVLSRRLRRDASDRDAQRLAFVLEAIERFARWWAANHEAEHVDEHRQLLARHAERLEVLLAQRLVRAPLLTDLRAELAVYEAALLQARRQRDEAHAALARHLGRAVAPGDAAVPVWSGKGSPWDGLGPRLASHPALLALAHRASLANGEALAARRQAAPVLSVGLGVRQAGLGSTFGVLTIGGTFDARGSGEPQAAAAEGRAAAALVDKAAVQRQLGLWVEQEARRWSALAAELARLDERVVKRLAKRVDTFQEALAKGQVTIDALFRARRDLLESHHQKVAVTARMLASQTRAAALGGALEGAGGKP